MSKNMPENFKERITKKEENLDKRATKSYDVEASKRDTKDFPNPYRTPFQRDRDRIIHSKAFRRLMHKTQLFVRPDSEHIRTRLTHTLEVMQIARTIARAVGGNEDLTEAIALGHDLGHTPFGHIGEEALNGRLKKYDPDLFFKHNVQSWRIVSYLEQYVRFPQGGLNLTQAVKFGILRHSGKFNDGREKVEILDRDGNRMEIHFRQTLEEKIVRISDDIAWLNHDWDDGVRSGLLSKSLLGSMLIKNLGSSQADRINNMVTDVIKNFDSTGEIKFSDSMEKLEKKLREKIKKYLWDSEIIQKYNKEAKRIIENLFDFFFEHPEKLPKETKERRCVDPNTNNRKKLAIVVADYISGMTDDWCLKNYETYIYSPYSRLKQLVFIDECRWIKIHKTLEENSRYRIKEPEYLRIEENTEFNIFESKVQELLENQSRDEKINESKLQNLKKGEAVYKRGVIEIKHLKDGKNILKDDILIIKD